MPAKSESTQGLEQQLRQVCDRLERRLRAGEQCQAEECLAAHPALAADSDATLELIYFEYVLREELGQEPSAEDWYRRFPEQQPSLEKIFQIHKGTHDLPFLADRSASVATLTPLQTLAEHQVPAKRQLGKYKLLEELGRGSMGVVYKAREPALDRTVALKMILAGVHAGPDQLVRFHREARAVVRLQHPNIVQIYEIGEEDGRPFLCMEYVDGPGLERLLARWHEQGGLGVTPRLAARFLETLAGAVHFAHQHGIIHRDLKPANILLQIEDFRLQVADLHEATTPSDKSQICNLQSAIPKIADFGLAKFLDGSVDATQTGNLVGTPSFMAPEQADARTDEVGPPTDVYALGVILYQLLTGRPPFQAPSVQETLELVRTAEPAPPRDLQPYLPRDLQTICLKCLAKEPKSRYPSAAALADDLRRFLAGEPIAARPATLTDRTVKWIKRRPVVAGLLAALLLAIVGGGTGVVWQWQRAEVNAAAAHRSALDFKHERDTAVQEHQRAERHLKRARDKVDLLAKLGNELCVKPQLNKTGKAVLEKVLAFYLEVLEDEGKNPVVRRETADVCGQVADIRHTLGHWDKAVEAYRQQSDLLRELLKEDRDNAFYRHLLARSLRFRANVLRDMGKTQEARAAYGESAKLHEQLLDKAPNNTNYRVSLANTLLNTASVLSRRDQAAEMGALYTRAVSLIKTSLAVEPNNLWYQSELALNLEGQGMLYWHKGQGSKAEKALREAVEIRQQQFNSGQMDHWERRYLARSYTCLGIILAGTKRTADAKNLYEQAVGILDKLVNDFPDVYYNKEDLVYTRTRQGILCQQLGLYREALGYYRQAVELDPGSGLAKNVLAWFLATSPEVSLRDSRDAVRLAKKAVAAQPASPAEVGNRWRTLGVAHYRDGDCKAAIAAVEKSMLLRSGGDSFDWYFLAMAHGKLGNRAHARRWFDKAVEWRQKNRPHDEELRRLHAEAQVLLAESAKGGK